MPENAVDLDQLLTNVSLYWFNATGATAAQFIYEAYHAAQDWGGAAASTQGLRHFRRG